MCLIYLVPGLPGHTWYLLYSPLYLSLIRKALNAIQLIATHISGNVRVVSRMTFLLFANTLSYCDLYVGNGASGHAGYGEQDTCISIRIDSLNYCPLKA